MILSKPQQVISKTDARFKVVVAGRRFGKSFLSINELAKFARIPDQTCLYVAPTYRPAKTDKLEGKKEKKEGGGGGEGGE